MRKYLNNDNYVCQVLQITRVSTVVGTYILKESQLVTFCFLWWEWGSEGKGGQLVEEGQERALDAFHSTSSLLSCLGLCF